MHFSFPVDSFVIADHVAQGPDADEGQNYDEVKHARYIRLCIAFTTPGHHFWAIFFRPSELRRTVAHVQLVSIPK